MVQSSNTKLENLEHDFDEIVAKVQELGWKDGKRLSCCWVEKVRAKVASLPLKPGITV